MIIRFQTAAPQQPIKDIEGNQQVDGAVPFVLELMSRALPRPHRLRRLQALQRLNVGLLVNTDHHLASLAQPPYLFVAP